MSCSSRFDEKDVMGFLALLAKKKGKLLRGGTPDRNAAARYVQLESVREHVYFVVA